MSPFDVTLSDPVPTKSNGSLLTSLSPLLVVIRPADREATYDFLLNRGRFPKSFLPQKILHSL